MDPLKCPHCGKDTPPNIQRCPHCNRGLSGRALMEDAQQAAGYVHNSTGTTLLVIGAVAAAAISWLFINQATLGVGMLAGGCLAAILARVAQAGSHHREIVALLRRRDG